MNSFPFFLVDAFTDKPFSGNPAGVCLIPKGMTTDMCQHIAAEVRQAETAFIEVNDNWELNSELVFPIRWFTPLREVSICGHATLASAHVLFNEYNQNAGSLTFKSKSDSLIVRQLNSMLSLEFPADIPEKIKPDSNLLNALGIIDYMDAFYGPKTKKTVIRINDDADILSIKPDYTRMMETVESKFCHGVGVTKKGKDDWDFISRYFNPWYGVNEDAVTGSVHTVLGPYWSQELGKNKLKAFQSSFRGGKIELLIKKDCIIFYGKCTTMIKGEMFIYN